MVRKKIKKTRNEFKKRFNTTLITTLSAAFGFLLALLWREPISAILNNILKSVTPQQTILIQLTGAIIATIIIVLTMMVLEKNLKKTKQ